MKNPERVGVIGLGAIGEPMARNAIEAGFSVSVLDPNPEPVRRLVELGARAALTPEDMAAHADVVQVVVSNDAQLESVVQGGDGEGGLLATHRQGLAIVVHSTVHPDTCRRLAKLAAAAGGGLLDAPVNARSGSEAAVKERALTYLIGGDVALLERVRPVLEASGTAIFHMGDVGAGQATKLAANAMVLIQMEAAREALALAIRAGLEPARALEAWSQTTARGFAVESWDRIMEQAGGQPSGPAIVSKDINLALELGEALGVELPLLSRLGQLEQQCSLPERIKSLMEERRTQHS